MTSVSVRAKGAYSSWPLYFCCSVIIATLRGAVNWLMVQVAGWRACLWAAIAVMMNANETRIGSDR